MRAPMEDQTRRADPAQDLRFELGGPAYRLMQRVGLVTDGPSVVRRSLAFLAVGWVPLVVLSLFSGTAIGPTPRSSLLLDFAVYARLFVAVPLVFLAEALVGPRIRGAGLRIAEGGLVPPDSRPAFLEAMARVRRRKEATLPEIILLIVAVSTPWLLTVEEATGIGEVVRLILGVIA